MCLVAMKSCITISLVEEARGGPFVLWDGLERSIAFAGELGYDAVEIFSPSVEALNLDSLGSLLDAAGVKLAALGHRRWLGQASIAAGGSQCRASRSGESLCQNDY